MKVYRLPVSRLAFCICIFSQTWTGTLLYAMDVPAPGQVIDTVICRGNPEQSYALYVPGRGNKEAMPVIYFFDPHGDGSLPLKKYRSLADKYGFIFIGSNNSKNGNDWPTTENIWQNISGDSRARLKIRADRVYTCGFSGGAKVAGYIAIQHSEIRGVIAGGAGLPDGVSAGDLPFTFTALAGEGDMNMTDLVSFSCALDGTRTRHRLILFDGKHEWAPESIMNTAFVGLQFDAMRQGLIPKDNGLVLQIITAGKKQVEMNAGSHQLIKAVRQCRLTVALLDGLTPETGWFKEKGATLSADHLYQQEQQAQEKILVTEENKKAEYGQHFQQTDNPYWIKTIHELEAGASGGSALNSMNRRLLAYLSLAFYSLSNQCIGSNRNSEARYFVDLYKIADPTNSEAWYLSAVLDIREGHTSAAAADLQKASTEGFKDKKRLMGQPEFVHRPALNNIIH